MLLRQELNLFPKLAVEYGNNFAIGFGLRVMLCVKTRPHDATMHSLIRPLSSAQANTGSSVLPHTLEIMAFTYDAVFAHLSNVYRGVEIRQ